MKYLLYEDGKLIENTLGSNQCLWDGLFSKVNKDGYLIKYLETIMPKNMIILIPKSDGNINSNSNYYHDINFDNIKPFIEMAKQKNKIFVIGILCNVIEESDINYLYLPLDDEIFNFGINKLINNNIKWENKLNDLFWRGGCSGIGNNNSLRVKVIKHIYNNYNKNTNMRLSYWWSENKNIPCELFADRVNYSEFTKYKIFFIIDGNCIASNHMFGFTTGSIPFVISNGIHWFSNLIKPFIHYIPIKYDLSDLIYWINYINNNDLYAKKIADNALEFSTIYFSSDYQKEYLKTSLNKLSNQSEKLN